MFKDMMQCRYSSRSVQRRLCLCVRLGLVKVGIEKSSCCRVADRIGMKASLAGLWQV